MPAHSEREPTKQMINTRLFYFAFTYRFFSNGKSGPANCKREVLKT
jgi:hypothetical protein